MHYWIVRYKRNGRSKPRSIPYTLRGTRFLSIRAFMTLCPSRKTWPDMRKQLKLECVKVRLDTEYYNDE